MDIVVFFVPILLVIAQYLFADARTKRVFATDAPSSTLSSC